MQCALMVRPASTRVITPITMNNISDVDAQMQIQMQTSLSGTMPEPSNYGSDASVSGAGLAATSQNAGNPNTVLTIAGSAVASHRPRQLTRLIRSSHSGKSMTSTGGNSMSSIRTGESTAATFGMNVGIAGYPSHKSRGKIAKSSLARGSAHGDGSAGGLRHALSPAVDAHAPAVLPSLSTTQLNFNRHVPLNEHLQPSGISRSLHQDNHRIHQHLQLGNGQGMGVLGGMGWMRGHRPDETEN